MKLIYTSVLLSGLFASQAVFAGECVLAITRTACPGKEAEAFKPYDGKTTTEEKKKLSSAGACIKAGEGAARIIRKGTLSGKSVEAKFDGAAVAGSPFSAKAECS